MIPRKGCRRNGRREGGRGERERERGGAKEKSVFFYLVFCLRREEDAGRKMKEGRKVNEGRKGSTLFPGVVGSSPKPCEDELDPKSGLEGRKVER